VPPAAEPPVDDPPFAAPPVVDEPPVAVPAAPLEALPPAGVFVMSLGSSLPQATTAATARGRLRRASTDRMQISLPGRASFGANGLRPTTRLHCQRKDRRRRN
jgi:hypothetical protein